MGRTAFVLSGGGSLGAVQVGMLHALSEHGITPDLLIGTSAGALNAAYLAGRGMGANSLENLETIWTNLRRGSVFPLRPLRMGAAALGRAPSLCHDDALRGLIRKYVEFDRLEDAPIPVHLVATDLRSGCEVVLSDGDTVDAVMASAAIPAVFPAVHIGGRELIDGGVADNASISEAVACGAERIYVLPTGYACALDEAPASALASALHALTLLIEQRLIVEIVHLGDQADIRVLPPLCPLSVSSIDFRSGALLIDQARAATNRWLDRSDAKTQHPERVLSLHQHHLWAHDATTPHSNGLAS